MQTGLALVAEIPPTRKKADFAKGTKQAMILLCNQLGRAGTGLSFLKSVLLNLQCNDERLTVS